MSVHNRFSWSDFFQKRANIGKIAGLQKTIINYLLKLCFFGSNYSNFGRSDVVHNYRKLIIVHKRSMSRITCIFWKYGKSTFGLTIDGKEYACAGKIVEKEIRSGREGISYTLDDETMITESDNRVDMIQVQLSTYNNEYEVWTNSSNSDQPIAYCAIKYHPIWLKLYNSGNL